MTSKRNHVWCRGGGSVGGGGGGGGGPPAESRDPRPPLLPWSRLSSRLSFVIIAS